MYQRLKTHQKNLASSKMKVDTVKWIVVAIYIVTIMIQNKKTNNTGQ